MISLTSLAFSLFSSFAQQAPEAPPLVRTTVVPPPVITVPARSQTSAETKAQLAKIAACRQSFYGQTYLPQPPLYRLTDADTTLYILGSIHSLPLSFDWRSPDVDRIVSSSDRLVTENGTESLPDNPDPLAGLRTPTAAPPKSAHPPLRDRLEGERRAKWLGMNAVGARYLMDWLDRQPDWRAALTILGFSTRTSDVSLAGGVEAQLRADFKNAKKPIEGLEKGKDVIAMFDTLSPAIQRKMLETSFDLIGQPSRSGDYMAMIHNWARGEDVVEPLESTLPAELREVILDRRNAAWVPEVRKHLGPPGTRLVVVGAGHLAGRNNLVELLTAAGLKPERISRTGTPLPRPAYSPRPSRLSECFASLKLPPPPAPPPPPPAK